MFLRDLSHTERAALKKEAYSFTVRRCQILLASSEGLTPKEVAAKLQCSEKTVRKAIQAFHTEGLSSLKPQPRSTRIGQAASDKRKMTVSEVARLLGVHPNTVRRWSDAGILPTYRIGTRGDRRFRSEDMSRLLASTEVRKGSRSSKKARSSK